MRQQHDSELEMELIPRQTSIGIDSSSVASASSSPLPSPSPSSSKSFHFMSMNQFAYDSSISTVKFWHLFQRVLQLFGSFH